jgi:hypothetical protein
MYPANYTLNRQIQTALYSLKRQYGGSIDIYKLTSSAINVRTGEKVLVKTVTHVDRAVVVPARISREVVQSISLISANKQLVMGGGYDLGVREFIVDRRDCPDLPNLNEDDYIVYNSRKYQIKNFEEFEFNSAWIITGKELIGEVPEQIHLLGADNLLNLSIASDTE